MKDIELPPLPDADVTNNTNLIGYRYSYSAIAMQAYARAAMEAAQAQRVPDVEDLKDRLVAISSAVADSDDREAQAIIRTTLELLASTPAPAPAPAQQEPTEDAGITRGEWIGQAVRVYLAAGDTEADASECAAYLWREQDMADLEDPLEAALSDIEGRPIAQHQEPPQQERKPKRHACDDPLCAVCGHHGIKE